MPQSITSILNQPIRYFADDVNCKCGERENCVLVASNQQVYSQLKISPCSTYSLCNNVLSEELVCNGSFDLGQELVTNGTFTGSATGWTLGTNWAYSADHACANNAAAGQTLSQTIASLVDGKMYRVVYTVTAYTSGDVAVTIGGTTGATRSADGTYSELLVTTAGTTLSFERVAVDFRGCIDDVSVTLLDCWELSAGWEWVNGAMCLSTAPANLTQNIAAISNGQIYQLTFTISNYVTGTLTPFVGGGNGAAVSADGIHQQFITSTGANTLLDFVDAASFEGCIDDISLKQLSPCWDSDETDWHTNGTGSCHDTGNTTDLDFLTSITAGKYYHVIITVSASSAGGINIVLGTTVINPQTSGNGTFDFWGTSDGTTLSVRPTTDFDGCVQGIQLDEYCTEYEFHLIPAKGDEFVVADITPYYTLIEDVYNLTDFTFDEVLKDLENPYGCYKLCLVDCCAEQQTTPLLRNGNFSAGSDFWTSQNVIFTTSATFISDSGTNFIEQALISTHDADCMEIEFFFGNEAVLSQAIRIYINGVLVDTENVPSGAGFYNNTFNDVPAGAIIRIETGGLIGDIVIDNITVTVPEECQPLYDQCTPCINFQPSFNCTKLVEGYCDGEALGFHFDDAGGNNQFKLSLRTKCELLHPTYDQEQEDYDFSNGVTSLSFGQNKKFQALTFFPMPEYKHDVISLEKICDTFQIDTVDYFVKKGDYNPEWDRNTNTDLAPSRIEVKKKDQTLYNTNCG